ncbi:fumarylacetoacetate hydrolase family protein [Kiloniella laminariae]|uniref:Fumarylacetoacetate hydrolase family protein n=1 Tax=Kiloniella laminariae TaxID=454162 RepID=A0ABT4LLF7_9PROT|nr:fumarylacetoacetate hydrolase family protein [Kiloniella laminariae]MCZ4281947.1 fumarylacetoacetate hydrolase family protein [Kiloniella laminariae]
MTYIFEPAAITSLSIAGNEKLFPVRRIFCVGRNYAEHTREMGGNPETETPVFFLKPAEALVPEGRDVPYPSATEDFHHEVELVVALKSGGTNISASESLQHVFGFAVGVDLTRRDLQKICKDNRHPWDVAKAFELSAPCGKITPCEKHTRLPDSAEICLTVNNEPRQKAQLGDMIWSVENIIVHLSRLFELRSGDIIMTGTPAGVGPLHRGEIVTATVEGLEPLVFRIS